MKRIVFLFFGLATLGFMFTQCFQDQCTSTQSYVRFDPIYKTEAEARQDFKAEAPRPLHKPGKIYAIGQYLLINEFLEGIHVVDNSDPAHPNPIAFWNIPGNVDMAVKDNRLYADQYMDLLTIDVSNLTQPTLISRKEKAFPLFGFEEGKGYIVDYNQSNIEEEVPCSDRSGGGWIRRGNVILMSPDALAPYFKDNNFSSGAALAAAGIAGSYARFAISGERLYTVDNVSLRVWSTGSAGPESANTQSIGSQIETIFPWKNKLFIGSKTGVLIFDNSNPDLPVYESGFAHATGCDPVVCDDNYAFVTIHDGTDCNGTINQLDVIDIRNLPNATLSSSYTMARPMGLGLAGNYLYLCDDGLKIFDRSDVNNLKELAHLSNIKATDVIALNEDLLLVVGDSGFYQFDVSNPAKPVQMSLLSVK